FSRFIPDTSDRRKRLIICLLEDKDGHFWAGTASGLFGFDAKTGHFAPVFKGVRSAPGLNSDQIIVLKEDLFGNLWVGTRFGLHRIDLQTKQVTRYQYNPRDLRGINENHIMDLLVDSNGLLWVATYGGGLNKIIFQTKPFGFHPFEPDQVKGLSYRSILSIIEDKAGIVWLGTRGGGTNRWDRTTNQFRHYKRDPGNPNSIISDDIPIIIESKVEPGVLWLGTRSGLDRFDANSETFTHYYHNPEQDDSLSSRFVYALLEDRSGTLWVGTWGKGLNRFHRDTRTFTRYLPDRHNPSSISSNVIWDIHEDRQGHLWIGTGGGGLNRMDVKAGSFRCYRNQPENPDSLSNNHILSIHEDSNGFLWIGTLGGVNRFNPDKAECDRYSVKDGLPDNVIYGILEDNQGDLWFSTNKGLSRFNPKTKTFRNYSPQDGLQGYEFNQHSYFKNEQGELYFGGVNGFNVFYSHKILDNKNIPPVVFTDFKIFNRPVLIKPEGGSPLKSSILETNSITLPYNQHSISFEFSALDFTHPDRNQYAYKLDDINDDWIYLGNKNDINFANLAPGTYRLWVKGTNSDGIWNEQGTSIEIIITPPFWETWWFRGIMVLVVIILISILHLLRMRHITEKLKSEAVVERFFNKKGISSREREIILLILKGMSNKQIEDELYISLGTVKNHAFNIYKKLQINSRVQLVTLFKNLLPSVKQDQEMRRSQEDGGR
ncbi:MAG: hypothetical protein KAT17_10455, partial [Candidatus Aminicenantes bacterium]|nr:hypothetical protein [Candidatus Aminicenantes bacterium]